MKNSELFDYKNLSHRDFFDNYVYPWEVVKNIRKYLSAQKGKNIVGEGTVIDSSVKIEGRVIIGKNCRISDNVLLRDGVIIGDNVRIGHAVEVKNSVILNNSAIAHFNYIGDSVVGSHINIGGGVITANLRLDREIIKITAGDEHFDTELEKFGAAIGDGSSIGVNAVLNPGVILGKGSIVYPLTSVVGVFSPNSIIK